MNGRPKHVTLRVTLPFPRELTLDQLKLQVQQAVEALPFAKNKARVVLNTKDESTKGFEPICIREMMHDGNIFVLFPERPGSHGKLIQTWSTMDGWGEAGPHSLTKASRAVSYRVTQDMLEKLKAINQIRLRPITRIIERYHCWWREEK